MKVLIHILLTGFMSWVQAATEVSNGADAWVCRDSNGNLTAGLMELEDVRKLRTPDPALKKRDVFLPFKKHIQQLALDDQAFHSTEKEISKILNSLLDDFGRFHPGRAILYRNQLSQFWQNVKWLSDNEIEDIYDSSSWFVRIKGCQLKQLIVQRTAGKNKLYEINQDVWRELTLLDRTAAVLHELIYGELIALGHSNADVVENFVVAMLSSYWKERWISLDREKNRLHFAILAQSSNMPTVNWHNWRFELNQTDKTRTLFTRSEEIQVSLPGAITLDYHRYQLTSARLSPGQTLQVGNHKLDLSNKNVGFYPSAKVRFVLFEKYQRTFIINHKRRRCYGMIELTEDGHFKDCPQSIQSLKRWLLKHEERLGLHVSIFSHF